MARHSQMLGSGQGDVTLVPMTLSSRGLKALLCFCLLSIVLVIASQAYFVGAEKHGSFWELSLRKNGLKTTEPIYGDVHLECPVEFELVDNQCIKAVVAEPKIVCPYGSFQSKDGGCTAVDAVEPERVCPAGFEPYEKGCVGRSVIHPIPFCEAPFLQKNVGDETECCSTAVHDPVLTCTIGVLDGVSCKEVISQSPAFTCPDTFELSNHECRRPNISAPLKSCEDGWDIVQSGEEAECTSYSEVTPKLQCKVGFALEDDRCVQLHYSSPEPKCPTDFSFDYQSKECTQVVLGDAIPMCRHGWRYISETNKCIREEDPTYVCPDTSTLKNFADQQSASSCVFTSKKPYELQCREGAIQSVATTDIKNQVGNHHGNEQDGNQDQPDLREKMLYTPKSTAQTMHPPKFATGGFAVTSFFEWPLRTASSSKHAATSARSLHEKNSFWIGMSKQTHIFEGHVCVKSTPNVDGGELHCPDNYLLKGSGEGTHQCVAFHSSPPLLECQILGAALQKDGTCKSIEVIPATPVCEADSGFDEASGLCVTVRMYDPAVNCPVGSAFNEQAGNCVAETTRPVIWNCPEGYLLKDAAAQEANDVLGKPKGAKPIFQRNDVYRDGFCERVDITVPQLLCPVGYERKRDKKGKVDGCVAEKPVQGIRICEAGFFLANQECVKHIKVGPSVRDVQGTVFPCVLRDDGSTSCGHANPWHAEFNEEQMVHSNHGKAKRKKKKKT